MRRNLRIVVADDERDMREFFAEVLPTLGHQVVGAARSGQELVALAASHRPDLVITDVDLPECDGLQAAERLNGASPVPVIVVAASDPPDLLARAEAGPVLAFMMKPIRPGDLRPAIALAMRRFEQIQQLCRENGELRRDLEHRKLVERAKGALMKRLGVDEQQAFLQLRKRASDVNRKLVEVALEVLNADSIFHAFDAK